jgi:hypothetical protein
MRCRRCLPQAGHPGPGARAAAFEAGHPCPGARAAALGAGENQSRRTSTRTGSTYSRVGSSKCRSGLYETGAWPEVQPGRGFVPVLDAGDAGQHAGMKAGLPIPGR